MIEIVEPNNTDYVFYWFKYRWFDFNKDKMFGTAIPYIRLGNLQEFRLLSHLLHNSNALLTVLKACLSSWMRPSKRHRKDVLHSFGTRKAAILYKAFTAELTAQWRKEHGVAMES